MLSDTEMAEVQKLARQNGMAVGEWVRNAIRDARARAPRKDAESKLAAIRAAVQYSFPTADVKTMLEEIEGGYLE
jgi:hypothetical protein